MKKGFQQGFFVMRFWLLHGFIRLLRKQWFCFLGMQVSRGTLIPPMLVTWPHQIRIGYNCKLEPDIYFKYDGIWQSGPSILIKDENFIGRGCEFNIKKGIQIGNNCLIGSGCKFIDHDHGINLYTLIKAQPCKEEIISIGDNVWLGTNVIILKGVRINNGAVVAAGAVVNTSIPTNEIWAGVPAKKIGSR